MRRFRFFFIPFIFLPLIALGAMALWNWLMPSLFGLGVITFWQAAGLLILIRILIGPRWFGRHIFWRPAWHGHGAYHYGYGNGWRMRMQQKWSTMTPEEREKWATRWGCDFSQTTGSEKENKADNTHEE